MDVMRKSSLLVTSTRDRPNGGDRQSNRRGEQLLELSEGLGLVIINTGREPTFHGIGSGSIVDITFASEPLSRGIRDWVVLDEENYSDHHYIMLTLELNANPARSDIIQRKEMGWVTSKGISVEVFKPASPGFPHQEHTWGRTKQQRPSKKK